MWIEIAARNLRKNWRRSLFSIFAICIGFTAVNIFGGFTAYIFENLRESFIYGGGNGHVTVVKKGFLDQGRIDPVNYLPDETIQAGLQQQLDKLSGIAIVGRQLRINGLVSNGEVSTIFIAEGRLFSAYNAMRERAQGVVSAKNYDGRRLLDSNVYEIALSEGLSRALNLTLESEGMVTAPTVDGYVNALDFKVAQVFRGAPETLDDKLLIVPLSFAQSLYDTRSVERVNILLDEHTDTENFIQRLQQACVAANLDVDIRSWDELSIFYNKLKNMFDILFAFVFVIVFLISAMSVVNTVSMAVLERTREIGTLRALGANRTQILRLFLIESGLLALIGVTAGLVLTLLVWWGIGESELSWVPPIFTARIPLEVYLVPSYLMLSSVVFLSLSVIATLSPVWRANRRGIVDALGHI
ncbi:MAG: FtsX-like permease family protein [Xanthomonadales bacterium]|nr:FtsX-like permease family protein [Xanthomonadales bacterium]